MSLGERFWDLLGSWAGVEEQLASPWAPAARTRAALVLKLDLARTAVLQDYRQVRDDGAEARERRRAEVGAGRESLSPPTTEFLAHGVFLVAEDDSDIVLWWLFAAWNPVSAITQGARELFGNTALVAPSDSWPLQHPVVYTLIWVVIILAVFVPLTNLQYRRAASR